MNLDIIIPICDDYELVQLCVDSIKKYTPKKYKLRFIIVENVFTLDTPQPIKNISKVENILHYQNYISVSGSEANACAIYFAQKYVQSDYVLMLHNDVVMCHEKWLDYLFELMETNTVAGFLNDNIRIKAIHISGLLTKKDLFDKICNNKKLGPYYKNGKQILDVGDSFTSYCQQFKKPYAVLPNTHNDINLVDTIKQDHYKSFKVDRCVVDGNVLSMHLGRGTLKARGSYIKEKDDKVTYKQWLKFCKQYVVCEKI